MSTIVSAAVRARVPLRPLALPAEHGAWGLLLEPIALGLLVAPSRAGLVFALGAVGAFLARHPLKFAVHDWLRGRRYPRTRACELLAAAYLLVASVGVIGAWKLAGSTMLVPLLPASIIAFVQFFHDVRRRGRSRIAELSGASAAACLAAAIALAGGEQTRIAVSLTALMLARSLPSIFYVRSALHGEARVPMMTMHTLAILLAMALWNFDLAPWSATLSMLALFGRAWWPLENTHPRSIGFREVAWGAMTVLLIAIGYF